MSLSAHTVLVTTCAVYDDEGDPPDARTVATAIGTPPATVCPVLQSLCQSEFLAETTDGYRPTVTARELLDRGIHLDDVAAVDVVEEG